MTFLLDTLVKRNIPSSTIWLPWSLTYVAKVNSFSLLNCSPKKWVGFSSSIGERWHYFPILMNLWIFNMTHVFDPFWFFLFVFKLSHLWPLKALTSGLLSPFAVIPEISGTCGAPDPSCVFLPLTRTTHFPKEPWIHLVGNTIQRLWSCTSGMHCIWLVIFFWAFLGNRTMK